MYNFGFGNKGLRLKGKRLEANPETCISSVIQVFFCFFYGIIYMKGVFMNWEKGNFLITTNENGDMVRHNVAGVISSVGKFDIGIHKAGGWVVTDISTGYQIRMCETQKQAKS